METENKEYNEIIVKNEIREKEKKTKGGKERRKWTKKEKCKRKMKNGKKDKKTE